jgi:hypothetical protein
MNKKMKYLDVFNAEQSPDCYHGKDFDEHKHYWKAFAEGDKESDALTEINLSAELFPAGTIITVKEPCCPDCGVPASICIESECEFDWKQWTEIEFS